MERWQLRATTGSHTGAIFHIDEHLLIGRGKDVDIQLLAPGVSRQHAHVIARDDGSFVVVDLSSGNGTQVGGKSIKEHVLAPGDVIAIGQSSFRFEAVRDNGPVEIDEQIKQASGRALDVTTIRKTKRPAKATDCDSPLHEHARTEGWRFCPQCAAVVS